MCGIAAIRSKEPDTLRGIKAALAVMEHRGPDHSGIWSDSEVAIGHRRLVVRGAPTDSQPILNETGRIAISVNGEFYESDRIRSRLEERGHIFRTTSDSEIALHLYEEFGLQFFEYLRGEFAFVIWDGDRQRLLAVRDRFGIKPLCYAVRGDDLMIASEAKALFAAKFVAPAWDLDSGWHSLAHQYLPPEKTLFQGVKSVPPARYLLAVEGQSPVIRPFWKPVFAEESVPADAIRERLIESVKLRLDANVRPAFSLSGGIDSSAVVSIGAKESGRPVPAFSVSFFDGEGYDEFDKVEETATALGADLHRVPVSREAMVTQLSDAVYYSEGLAINGQLVGKFLLSKAINKAGFNVVLSGEGADEAFLGYAHLETDADAGAVQRAGPQAGVMLPKDDGSIENDPPPEWLGRWPSFLRAKMNFAAQYEPLLREDGFNFARSSRIQGWLSSLNATNEIPTGLSFPKVGAWLWTRTALSGYILRTLADGTEMAHSVEGRVPFLDHTLFELALRIRTAANLSKDGSKRALRESLRDIVPEPIRVRPKHPFLAPPLLKPPYPDVVMQFIADSIHSSAFAQNPFFDQRKVGAWFERLKGSASAEKADADPALMTILSSAMLQERYSL
jgi:asparagine synthase (glutamine-hydrolysing)